MVRLAPGPRAEVVEADVVLSFAQVAERLGVSRVTVDRWSRRESKPLQTWKAGGRRFTTERALNAFLVPCFDDAGRQGS